MIAPAQETCYTVINSAAEGASGHGLLPRFTCFREEIHVKPENSSLYRLPACVYTPGSDLLILSGELKKVPRKEALTFCVELFTLEDVEIAAVSVSFRFFSADGEPVGEPVVRDYPCGSLARDTSFGGKTEHPAPEDAASFEAAVCGLKYDDGSVQEFSEDEAVPLTHRRTLEEAFGDPLLADQFRIRYGEDCRFERTEEAGLWFCVCGGFNHTDEDRCHLCSRPKRALYDINADALRVEADARLRAESAEGKEPRAVSPARRKKRLWWLVLLVPVLFLGILLAGAIPRALERERRYQEASALLEAGSLDEAEDLFAELPTYRDSDTLAEKEIPYIRASRLLAAAEEGDAGQLSLIGKGQADLSEDCSAPMLFYEAAAEAFEAIGDYKDSADIAARCREEVDGQYTKLKQGQYDDAAASLADLHYSAAAEAFRRLGAFSDSKSMIQECRYQKALSLFHFLSSYDVSRIRANITMEPGAVTVFTMPKDEALRLGSGCIAELQAACGKDSVDVRLEEKPAEDLPLFKDALAEFFGTLGSYKDSSSYPDRIAEETDYTREFYMLCSTGDLVGAAEWLVSYQGDFPERQEWLELLKLYLPYCQTWDLFLGDSSLLPFTVGQSFQCNSVSSRVLLTRDIAVIRLSFGRESAFTLDLAAVAGDVLFLNRELDSGNYVATINHVGHLIFTRYDGDFNSMSSCEYEPVA